MPEVIRCVLENWVQDHVDGLIAEFAPAAGKDHPAIGERESDGCDSDSSDVTSP